MTNTEICYKAMKSMKHEFSSNLFVKKIKHLGIDDYFITSGRANQYLLLTCDRGITRRSWVKNNNGTTVPTFEFDIPKVLDEHDAISKAVEILKRSGLYRVMRKQEEWVEI